MAYSGRNLLPTCEMIKQKILVTDGARVLFNFDTIFFRSNKKTFPTCSVCLFVCLFSDIGQGSEL
jgi:hypothetical protein